MSIQNHLKSTLSALASRLQSELHKSSAPAATQGATTQRGDLAPNPLDPTWIQEGNPVTRSIVLTQSSDQLLSSGMWECTAGKFKFIHDSDEIVHILEGEVTVRHGGATYALRPGDVLHVPAGLTTYWDVPKYVKKFWVQRFAERSLLGRVRSRLGL